MRCARLLIALCIVTGCNRDASMQMDLGGEPDLLQTTAVDLAWTDLAGVDLSGDLALASGSDLAQPPSDLADPCANGGCASCPGGCLGGMCVSGKCTTATVRNQQASPYGVALEGDYVYWTNFTGDMKNGTAWKQLKNGGDPIQIAAGQWGPRTIAVTGGRAFFNNFYGGTIMTVAPGETSATEVKGVPAQLREMAIDATH